VDKTDEEVQISAKVDLDRFREWLKALEKISGLFDDAYGSGDENAERFHRVLYEMTSLSHSFGIQELSWQSRNGRPPTGP
jgi:hypothetical protein